MQICAEESGAADTADPLGGSYYVEALTSAMEGEITREMAEIERMGGIVEAVKSGAIQAEVARQAYRDGRAVDAALRRLGDEARGTGNLMPAIMEAVKVYASLGEIARAMREVFGEHKEPVKF
jgi:methylmalonyl-CoA mutase N-terminal domain/subunit